MEGCGSEAVTPPDDPWTIVTFSFIRIYLNNKKSNNISHLILLFKFHYQLGSLEYIYFDIYIFGIMISKNILYFTMYNLHSEIFPPLSEYNFNLKMHYSMNRIIIHIHIYITITFLANYRQLDFLARKFQRSEIRF